MDHLQIAGQSVAITSPDLQKLLEEAYGRKERPLCMCRPGGVPVYIARLEKQFIPKRMPGSGFDHDADCTSYLPPSAVSGLGQVADAVEEDLETGITTLRLGFQLSHTAGKAKVQPTAKEKSSAVADRPRLTLRGFLHFLWEEAGLNRHQGGNPPGWFQVRKQLLEAASRKDAKSRALTSMLYIPEPFYVEQKEEIAARRRALFNSITSTGSTKKLMIAIGEMKDYTETRFGMKVVLKHLPDCFFFCNEDLEKRILKRFGNLLQWRLADDRIRIITVMTFGISVSGIAEIEEISFMPVDRGWLPVESAVDLELTQDLIATGRRFRKCLRYNLTSQIPMASILLTDCQPHPVAMYLVPGDADDGFLTKLTALIGNADVPTWLWCEGAAKPTLPDRTGFVSMALERSDSDGPNLADDGSPVADMSDDDLGTDLRTDDEQF